MGGGGKSFLSGGNQKFCWEGGGTFFLPGGENLRSTDFGDLNIFQS